MENTTDVTSVTDDDLEKNITELSGNTERTDDQNKELDSAKQEKQTRTQKRIDKMTWEKKSAQEEAQRAKQEAEDYKQRLDDLEAKANAQPVPVTKETMDIAGKQYYTDATLRRMIDSKEMTEENAYTYQQERIEEKAADKAYQRIKGETAKTSADSVRTEDNQKVLTEYPHFNQNHPSFNPEDPLYKEASRIYANGYNTNPKGMSLAVEDAKRNLRIGDNIDASDDLSMRSSTAPNRTAVQEKKEEFVMTEEHNEMADRMYRDKTNDKTNKIYTQSEARDKYKQAMQKTAQRRMR